MDKVDDLVISFDELEWFNVMMRDKCLYPINLKRLVILNGVLISKVPISGERRFQSSFKCFCEFYTLNKSSLPNLRSVFFREIKLDE